ncbi:MAG: hypothetical protein AAF773_00845 [Cyanobacteria bacterium P01_D01_bin.115]
MALNRVPSIVYDGVRIPRKYVQGLTGETRRRRLAAIARARKAGQPIPRDIAGGKAETRESIYTKAFRRRFGNGN